MTRCDSYPQFPWSLLGMPGLVGHIIMTSLLACTHEKKEARLINTLSPNIHIQILQTDLYIFP